MYNKKGYCKLLVLLSVLFVYLFVNTRECGSGTKFVVEFVCTCLNQKLKIYEVQSPIIFKGSRVSDCAGNLRTKTQQGAGKVRKHNRRTV